MLDILGYPFGRLPTTVYPGRMGTQWEPYRWTIGASWPSNQLAPIDVGQLPDILNTCFGKPLRWRPRSCLICLPMDDCIFGKDILLFTDLFLVITYFNFWKSWCSVSSDLNSYQGQGTWPQYKTLVANYHQIIVLLNLRSQIMKGPLAHGKRIS